MKDNISHEAFKADIMKLEKELAKHAAVISRRISTLRLLKTKLEEELGGAKNAAKAQNITDRINQNSNELTFYEQSQKIIDVQARLIHAIGVNFDSEFIIDPKLATTNALEKLLDFEDIMQSYKDSVVSKDIIGSAVVLLERCKLMRLKFEKYGVEYTNIHVGENRGQPVEPKIHLKKKDVKFMTFSGGGG